MSCPERGPLEEEVLRELRPTKLQLAVLNRLYHEIRSRLEKGIRGEGLSAVIEPEGSFAKGTMTRDHWELDIFVLFKDVDDEWIAKHSREVLERALAGLPIILKYSEHPYVTVSLLGIEADVVPAIYLEEPPKRFAGVSRTPFHTRFVSAHLDECMKDDVRLLKSFFRGIGVYGAEAHVGGFSGYLTELLIIYYGSFRDALKAIASWRPPVFIDLTGRANRNELLRRYGDSPLIFVDPVDISRNAAASVTQDKMAVASVAAKLYLANPRKEFFNIFSSSRQLRLAIPVVLVVCRGDFTKAPPGDVWGRLARASRSLESELSKYGFRVLRRSVFTDTSSITAIGLLVQDLVISNLEVVAGPEAWANEKAVLSFLSDRDRDVWFNGHSLMAVKRRKFTRIDDITRQLIEGLPLPAGTSSCDVLTYDDVRMAALSGGVLQDWIAKELGSIPAWLSTA